MKPHLLRVRPPAQIDLFDCAAAPPVLTSLELNHDDLVALLSQLIWQVAHDAEANGNLEKSDEQDQS